MTAAGNAPLGCLRRVYAKRAVIRGQQPPSGPDWSQEFQNWPPEHDTEDHFY